MTLDLVSFSELAGVPVQPAPRKLGRATLHTIEAALYDLWQICPWGSAERIVHGGAYVNRPDPHGTDRHAQGRALDIMSIRWEGQAAICSRAAQSTSSLCRYLAITAVLEQHLGCVLNYWQPDGKHRSHWHLDDHRAPGWSPEWRPSVRFLQAALTHCWGRPTDIDGIAGPKTMLAARDVLEGLGCTEPMAKAWPILLRATARRGFALVT